MTPELAQALSALPPEQGDDMMRLFPDEQLSDRLLDLGEGRLREMDRIGLDLMVLSITTPGTQLLPAAQAVPLARQANDRVAAAVRAHPDRYAGFATLPTPDPAAAVAELQRAVQELGLCGAMIHGRTGDKYLDHADFRPLLAMAASLDVPVYLHPQLPPRAVRAAYYDGFGPELSALFAAAGWGWHLDAGVAALRLMLAGTFDALPTLQVVLGHWGEMLPFYLERTAVLTPLLKGPQYKGPQKAIAEYLRQNFYVTGSGQNTTAYLLRAVEVMSADRVMFSTDYPEVVG